MLGGRCPPLTLPGDCLYRQSWIAMCWGDAVFFRRCRETPSGGACWDIFPGGSCRPCWPGWPICCRWPVGPYGTLSPSDANPAGPAGLYVAGGPVGPDGTLSPFYLTLLDRLAVQVALLARMGLCPHLTLTLLARLAHMLQGALLAQMGRCPRFSLTLLARLALQVAL